jgi:hypothetical protein
LVEAGALEAGAEPLVGAYDLEVAISLSCRGCCAEQHPEASIVERDDSIEVGHHEGAAVGMDSAQQCVAESGDRTEVDNTVDSNGWYAGHDARRRTQVHDGQANGVDPSITPDRVSRARSPWSLLLGVCWDRGSGR